MSPFADETNSCSVICKLNEEVTAVLWSTIIDQQSEKEGAQHTTLRGPLVLVEIVTCSAGTAFSWQLVVISFWLREWRYCILTKKGWPVASAFEKFKTKMVLTYLSEIQKMWMASSKMMTLTKRFYLLTLCLGYRLELCWWSIQKEPVSIGLNS